MPAPLKRLCERLKDGDVAALARAISLVDSQDELGRQLHQSLRARLGNAEVVGITGPPGAGKSTLISALITELRQNDKRVAVVAVDPSSPITGGSVLGDRTRMGKHTDDPGVFIRSVAARGHLGGLSASIARIIDLIDAAGWDLIVLETVGAGQSETEVAEVADIKVVLNAPGLGDDVQAIKAGILEIADVLVVNKADSPLADKTARQLKAMLQLREKSAQAVQIVSTVATEGTGIGELLDAIQTCSAMKYAKGRAQRLEERTRRLLAQEAAETIKRQVLGDQTPATAALLTALASGDLELQQAVAQLLAPGRNSDG